MKLFLVCALVVIALASVEGGSKGQKTKNSCDKTCPDTYDPVCAKDVSVMGGRPRTFANECVMEKHNCEHVAEMQVTYKGECENAGGIRIS